MVLSLLASLSIMVLALQRRDVPGARAMLALAAATFIWTLGFFLEAHSTTLEQQLFFTRIGYIGSLSVPIAWFLFALNYSSGTRLITGWKLALLCLFPAIFLALVWSNDLHHLMWYNEHLSNSGSFTITVKTYGIAFWIALTYNYLFIISGAIILIRRLFTGTPLYAGQAISLLVAICLPLTWNIIYVFDFFDLPRKDLTPVMFAFSGLSLGLGTMRFQLLGAVPFARRFIIDNMRDGVLIFNMQQRLLEANPAALTMLDADRKIVGKDIDLLAHVFPFFKKIRFSESGCELTWESKERSYIYEFDTVAMLDIQNHQSGWLVTLRDISERNRRELEYRTIIQTTSDGFCIVDMEGYILDVNEAYCELSGYGRDELLNMHISEIEAIEKPEDSHSRVLKIQESGRDCFETCHRCKDGHLVHVEISINYLKVHDGRLFIFIRDITERKQAEEKQLKSAEKIVNAMNAAVEAMARTVEMRDPYTAGHQRRVTRLAVAIAIEMDFQQEFIDGLRMAAIVHDIGKIKVPAEILSKAEALSEAEYNLVKLHPEAGYNILKTIEFPWPVDQIVLQHHERMDGSGYPHGIPGEEILMEARILAVADVVESMSSHRPYRPALGLGKALEEIVKSSGTLYDSEVVAACIRLFHEGDFSLD